MSFGTYLHALEEREEERIRRYGAMNEEEKKFKLRPYQEHACDEAEGAMLLGSETVVLEAGTGSGKSAIIAEMARRFESYGVLILVNITALVDQIARHLDLMEVDYSILKAGQEERFDETKKVQLVMSQTFYARKEKITFPEIDLIIQDEGHKEWLTPRTKEILDRIKPRWRLGLSATPYDSAGYKLEKVDEIVRVISVDDLVSMGFLSPLRYMVPKWSQDINYDDMRTSGADYSGEAIDELIATPEYAGFVADSLSVIDKDRTKKVIVFANSISHCELITEALRNQGFAAFSYHSKSDKDSEAKMYSFRNNTEVEGTLLDNGRTYRVLVSVMKVAIGFDVPDIDIGVLCRPTKVRSLYVQQVGRVSRPAEGKEYGVILDLCGAVRRHGFAEEIYNPPKKGDKEALRREQERLSANEIDLLVDESNPERPVEVNRKMVLEKIEELERKAKQIWEIGLVDLIALFETARTAKRIIAVALEINRRKFGTPWVPEDVEWISGPMEDMLNEYPEYEARLLRAFKTRAKNIVKKGKKLKAMHFFPKWLKKQYPYSLRNQSEEEQVYINVNGKMIKQEVDYEFDEDEIPF